MSGGLFYANALLSWQVRLNVYQAEHMEEDDHRRVIAELDVLAEQVAGAIQRFEATGSTSVMKDDYVALHTLQNNIAEMRLQHSEAIDAAEIPCDLPPARH